MAEEITEKLRAGKLQKAVKREIEAVKKARMVSYLEYILFLLPVAGLNDILDFIAVTGLLKIVTLLIDFITAFLIFLWYIFRMGRMPPRFLFRFILVVIAELIPGIGMLPMWTIMVTYEFLKGRLIKMGVKVRVIEKGMMKERKT